ncbi:uncharacterized protein UV8b_08294 [Ustilaginoidea virens]|uniref:Protein kinase domain-containing protein n=1 Tax=Ustilaginoidea virens TaxID=1159556 RepID=A0A8E5HZ84_USTVR|nr:uncharacterized protein UV8b_08294 [Ustilaginoidea virens]QUC24053.1 hypothetical protein UV8b_08294 [Ustilaginoidea virens]
MPQGGRIAGDPFFLWKPLPDLHRPDFPYHRGLNLSIRRHRPPPPFGITGYLKGPERQESPPEPLRQVTQSEWCLQHPPANTLPHHDSSEHQLYIIDEIACEDGRGPQLVRCCLDEDNSQTYAAKIYDPLYYSYADRGFGTPVDVTWLADQHYSRECAAYEDLSQAEVDGILVPKYYGSWTFNMPLKQSQDVRPVRMVLMEWISGFSMQSLIDRQKVRHFSPEERLCILAKAMEVECYINFHGVRHGDFAPRNIMLEPSVDAQNHRVLLIDFNYSSTFSRPNCKWKRQNATRPTSPRYRYWGPCPNDFFLWVPEPHRSRPAAFQGWLKSQWEHSEKFADRAEVNLRPYFNYDEPAEMVPPQPDVTQGHSKRFCVAVSGKSSVYIDSY